MPREPKALPKPIKKAIIEYLRKTRFIPNPKEYETLDTACLLRHFPGSMSGDNSQLLGFVRHRQSGSLVVFLNREQLKRMKRPLRYLRFLEDCGFCHFKFSTSSHVSSALVPFDSFRPSFASSKAARECFGASFIVFWRAFDSTSLDYLVSLFDACPVLSAQHSSASRPFKFPAGRRARRRTKASLGPEHEQGQIPLNEAYDVDAHQGQPTWSPGGWDYSSQDDDEPHSSEDSSESTRDSSPETLGEWEDPNLFLADLLSMDQLLADQLLADQLLADFLQESTGEIGLDFLDDMLLDVPEGEYNT